MGSGASAYGTGRAALAAGLFVLAVPLAAASAQGMESDLVRIAEKLRTSTVTIMVAGTSGSGFVAGPERFIVTNAHVAQAGRWTGKVRVRFGDEDERFGEIVVFDRKLDLAVLRLASGVDAPPLPLGDSDAARVGETVVAVGSPYGLEATLTSGVISARRDIKQGKRIEMTGVLQTDAPINPGNSGGPLVNARGEVIGVNTAIVSRSGGNEGIGFAIPSRYVRQMLERARDKLRPSAAAKSGGGQAGEPLGVWLGAEVEDFAALGYEGVRVLRVIAGGPAERAGLRGQRDPAPRNVVARGLPWSGDIILAIGGKAVRNTGDLKRLLRGRSPGAQLLVDSTIGPGAMRRKSMLRLTAPPQRAASVPMTPVADH